MLQNATIMLLNSQDLSNFEMHQYICISVIYWKW